MSSHATALHSIRQMSIEELLQEIEVSKQRDAEIETKLVGLFGTRTQLEKQLVSLESAMYVQTLLLALLCASSQHCVHCLCY
jgi:predicted  nucleic acid-binding Zn-ribbon protein